MRTASMGVGCCRGSCSIDHASRMPVGVKSHNVPIQTAKKEYALKSFPGVTQIHTALLLLASTSALNALGQFHTPSFQQPWIFLLRGAPLQQILPRLQQILSRCLRSFRTPPLRKVVRRLPLMLPSSSLESTVATEATRSVIRGMNAGPTMISSLLMGRSTTSKDMYTLVIRTPPEWVPERPVKTHVALARTTTAISCTNLGVTARYRLRRKYVQETPQLG
jgi:hypothetical protein